jgi:putative transposase
VIEFPRSTYYYRSMSQALGLTDEHLVELISGIQDELPGYGYRRVTHELRRRNHAVKHKRVARVMAEHGLGINRRRRFVRTTDSNHDGPIFPNLYRNVIPARPDLVWVADNAPLRGLRCPPPQPSTIELKRERRSRNDNRTTGNIPS